MQKKIETLLLYRKVLQELFEERIEASVNEPGLRLQVEELGAKIKTLDDEIAIEQSQIIAWQKKLHDSYQKRKVIEKIRENQYALYQKECARINERQNSAHNRTS